MFIGQGRNIFLFHTLSQMFPDLPKLLDHNWTDYWSTISNAYRQQKQGFAQIFSDWLKYFLELVGMEMDVFQKNMGVCSSDVVVKYLVEFIVVFFEFPTHINEMWVYNIDGYSLKTCCCIGFREGNLKQVQQ